MEAIEVSTLRFKCRRNYGTLAIYLTNEAIAEPVQRLTGKRTVSPGDILDLVYLTGRTEAECECGARWDCAKPDTIRAIAGHAHSIH